MAASAAHPGRIQGGQSRLIAWLLGASLALLAGTPGFAAGTATTTGVITLTPLVTISHPQAAEISGLAWSPRHGGILWLHNDSGDGPRLLAVTSAGDVLLPQWYRNRYRSGGFGLFRAPWPGILVQGASNIDWEDIARDPTTGTLYIADIGNNSNARQDLAIYVLPEPDPNSVRQAQVSARIPVFYPDQLQFPARDWRYDAEALFVRQGTLFLLTKHRQPGQHLAWAPGTRLYRLDQPEGGALTEIGQHPEVSLVTAADLAPDGRLAVLTYTRLWIFPAPGADDNWLAGEPQTLDLDVTDTGQAEAITWTGPNSLVLGSENRGLWTVTLPPAAATP